jgi:DNA-binding IscR family transcriptional regulator
MSLNVKQKEPYMSTVQTALSIVSKLQNRTTFTSAKTLATEVGVTVPVVRQVANSLTKSGVLASSRGRTGGFKLTQEGTTATEATVTSAVSAG